MGKSRDGIRRACQPGKAILHVALPGAGRASAIIVAHALALRLMERRLRAGTTFAQMAREGEVDLAQVVRERVEARSGAYPTGAEDQCVGALGHGRGRGTAHAPLVAHCHLGFGKLYRRTGQRQQAQEHLTTAITMYGEMDLRFWLEKAEEVSGR
jgi:hypothetical protein